MRIPAGFLLGLALLALAAPAHADLAGARCAGLSCSAHLASPDGPRVVEASVSILPGDGVTTGPGACAGVDAPSAGVDEAVCEQVRWG